MADKKEELKAEDWDLYWRGTREAAAYKEGGAQDEVLAQFWTIFFSRELPTRKNPQMLDIGCGNGAVIQFVMKATQDLAQSELSIKCLDYSVSAVQELHKRFPLVTGVSADAAQTPFCDQSFDIVSSQFGLEYAGPAAVAEAARLVALDGVLVAVLHLNDGAIYKECSINLEVIEGVQNCQILSLLRRAFEAGFALISGDGSNTEFQMADKKLAPAVKDVAQLIESRGKEVLGGMVYRLYTDIAHMYRRMNAYEPQDVYTWIDRMVGELDAYAGRMSSMLHAAMDVGEMAAMVETIKSRGLSVSRSETLHMGEENEAAAWVLVSQRSS